VPANRSRTHRWRETLDEICARGGGIEFSLTTAGTDTDAASQDDPTGDRRADRDPHTASRVTDLIWRVRLLEVGHEELRVEMPGAFGQSVELPIGADIVAAMAVGQNRWMFHSKVLGTDSTRERVRVGGRRDPATLRLRMPERVERCLRRDAYRVSTASLALPPVECWSLLDPSSALPAEVANRAAVRELEQAGRLGQGSPTVLPEVGPRFEARLANISGGGLGLILDPGARGEHSGLMWVRIDLRPVLAAPVGVTVRPAHRHLDSAQRVHLGCAFEFQFNPAHRAFVCEQIGRYVEKLRVTSQSRDAA